MSKPFQWQSPDTRLRHIAYARDREEERAAKLDEQDNQRLLNIKGQMETEQARGADLDQRDSIQEQMRFEQARGAKLDRRDKERPPPVSEWMPQRDEAAALRPQLPREFGPVLPVPSDPTFEPGGRMPDPYRAQGRLDYQQTMGEWERWEKGILPTPGAPQFEPESAPSPEKRAAWETFYNIYKENLDIRLAGLERTNQRRAVDDLPPLTEEDADIAARQFAQRQLQMKGAVQRGWGTAFKALDYPRQMVKEHVIEPIVPEFAQEIPGEVLEAALPPGAREIAGAVQAVGGPGVPDVTVTNEMVEEAASWVLDPWNLLPVVGWGPDLVRAANAARRGAPVALKGLLKNPQVRSFLDDAMRAAERGGPKVPGGEPSIPQRIHKIHNRLARDWDMERLGPEVLNPEDVRPIAEQRVIAEFGEDPVVTLYRGIGPDERPPTWGKRVEGEIGEYWSAEIERAAHYARGGRIYRVDVKASELANPVGVPEPVGIRGTKAGDEFVLPLEIQRRAIVHEPPATPRAAAGAEAPNWQPPIERLAERWPEVQKTWKVTKGARRAEMTKRTRSYMDRFDELTRQGLTPEEAKEGAFVEFGGEMPDVQLVEAFTTTVDESKALAHRALVDFPRETNHPLTGVRALEAITGMASKRTPRPHELKAIREVFGDSLADAIEKAIRDKDFMDTVMELWMFPKVVRSAFDISFPARQGAMTAFRHPLLWSKSIKDSVRAFADPDWMIREIDKLRKDKTMYGVKAPDGSVQDMEFGQILDEVMAVLPEDVEPFYHAGMAEKWFDRLFLIESGPIKRSRVAFTGAGNGLRAGMTRHWLNHWKNAGVDITPERLEKLGALLNALTGRATVPRGALFDILQATWWSPQYRLSGPQVIGTILKHGVGSIPRPGGKLVQSADAQIARIATENFVSFVTGGVGILSLLKASGLADVQLDPRSSDFGKIRLGPTRINFWGTSQLLARSIAQMVTTTRIDPELGPRSIKFYEPIEGYWKSGASPEFQIISDLLTGETYLGRQMYPSKERGISTTDILRRELDPTAKEGGQRILPLAILDIKDAIETVGLWGALAGGLGMIGMGAQAYEPRAAQELQNIPEFRHMAVPQIQRFKDFWVEVKDLRESLEEEGGIVVPPERAIRVLGEEQGRSEAFIDLAVDLRAGTASRKNARNPEYIRFIVENEDEIREDAPWLITQEIRLLIHEAKEARAAAAP